MLPVRIFSVFSLYLANNGPHSGSLKNKSNSGGAEALGQNRTQSLSARLEKHSFDI
jgi:hypothetical protein